MVYDEIKIELRRILSASVSPEKYDRKLVFFKNMSHSFHCFREHLCSETIAKEALDMKRDKIEKTGNAIQCSI